MSSKNNTNKNDQPIAQIYKVIFTKSGKIKMKYSHDDDGTYDYKLYEDFFDYDVPLPELSELPPKKIKPKKTRSIKVV